METLLTLPLPWSDVLTRMMRGLRAQGFQVDQSFDLRSARESMQHPELCTCPDHGTASCSCQYLVLLVRREGFSPLSLELHGNEEKTIVSLVQPPDAEMDAEVVERVRQAAGQVVPTGGVP